MRERITKQHQRELDSVEGGPETRALWSRTAVRAQLSLWAPKLMSSRATSFALKVRLDVASEANCAAETRLLAGREWQDRSAKCRCEPLCLRPKWMCKLQTS